LLNYKIITESEKKKPIKNITCELATYLTQNKVRLKYPPAVTTTTIELNAVQQSLLLSVKVSNIKCQSHLTLQLVFTI